jgi:two-component system, chemotaxis family, protein-glutamate methylesterase/glutaminase
MPNPIRVMVVDDSSFMRSALKRRIEQDARFKVIDTAENGREGVDKALALKPDVVTLDVEMPVMNGLEALKEIVAKSTIPVIMVSAITEAGAKITIDALSIGAVDFIPKSKGADLIHEKLLAAVNASLSRRIMATRRMAPPVMPPRPARTSTRVPARIVVIGSSTGGPQALQEVLRVVPANLPVPIVVAQHMPPQFTLALAKRLNDICPLRVVEAEDNTPLTAGTVYIGPGGQHLRVTSTHIKVEADKGESLYKPSVDVLAESAISAFGKQILGVMLTGMGNDGAKEFIRLHKSGGYTLVQDQASCVVYGMPRAVADAGAADELLPLDQIGGRIRSSLGL